MPDDSLSSVEELNSLEYSSTALGLMNMFIVGSGAVMQPLIGWLLDRNWTGTMIDGARAVSATMLHNGDSTLFVLPNGVALGKHSSDCCETTAF